MELAKFVMGFTHAPPNVGPKHTHTGMELVYHVGGVGETTIYGVGKESFADDTVLIYWPETPHDQTASQLGEDVCVMLDVSGVSWLPEGKSHLKIPRLGDSYLRQELLRFANTPAPMSVEQGQSLSLRATALLLDLLKRAKQEETDDSEAPATRQVELARHYVARHYKTLSSLREVATHVGLSLDYLRHRFQERHQMSLKQYLIDVRVNQAEHLLRHSPLPQKQIAEDCGFANVRYFSASFKRATGMTPGQFRDRS